MGLTKWTSEMTSKFISLYREQECLWRIDSLTYRDRDARDTALKNIILGMNLEDLTIEDVKKKIKHLRSTYMNEYNKIGKSARSGAGTSTIYKPSLTWFNEMDAFIKYVNVKRNTQSSSIAQPNTQNSESVEQTASGSMEMDQEIDTNRKQQHCQKRNADVQADATKEIPKKTDNIRPSQTVNKRTRLSQLTSAINDMKNMSSEINKVEDTNEFEIYGKYVGIQLKSMNEEDAILAQQEIQTILTQFKLKKVQRNRSTSHSTLPDYENDYENYEYLLSPTDCRGSADSNNQSHLSDTDVEDSSAAGLQYSDVQYLIDNDDETDGAVGNLDLINTAFRNA